MATSLPANFDLVKQGENHYNNLVVELNEDLAKLPETIFKSVFLPVFNGTRALTETDDVLKSWVGIAGAPGKEVQITDNTGKGLFKVPPLFDSSFIDSGNNNKGEQLSRLMSGYDLHRNVLPLLGDNFLNKELPGRVANLVNPSTPNKEHEQRWQAIFDRYVSPEQLKLKQSNLPKPGAMTDDDMSF